MQFDSEVFGNLNFELIKVYLFADKYSYCLLTAKCFKVLLYNTKTILNISHLFAHSDVISSIAHTNSFLCKNTNDLFKTNTLFITSNAFLNS